MNTTRTALVSVVAILTMASIATLTAFVNVYAQGNATESDSQFTAELTGESALPTPVTTNATGSAEFVVIGDGNTMRYRIDADNIDKVTDVFLAASSGGRFADLVELRDSVSEGVTGPISGTLVEGNFTASDFTGRANIDQMSDLLKLIVDGNAWIRVQTTDVPLGEIVGKITPNLPS
jgi:hypothetical protein